MTGRTHDLAAFTAINIIGLTNAPIHMTFSTLIIAVGANLIGGLAPDLDQPSSGFWHKIPAGSFAGRIIAPLLGGHRFLSHSIVGLILFGFIFHYLLNLARNTILVDMNIVWWAFMIGCVSHLIFDTITKEGVPWLFPIPIRFGIPPFKFLRIKTGGFIECFMIFPGLFLLNGYLFYTFYSHYIIFFKNL